MTAGPSGGAVRVSIDAGQSSIRVRVDGADGGEPSELSFSGIRAERSAVAQITELLTAHDAWGAYSVAVGLSGYDDDPAAVGALLDAAPSIRHAAIAHDSITGYLGANGDAHGVVAAVGTGVVVLGAGPRGAARVDGWGAIFGDAGSAHWIGRAAIDAVLRARDGRGRSTALTALAEKAFGDLGTLYLTVQSDPDRVSRVAAFARAVTACAETDEIANDIIDRAAAELANSIVAACRRAGVHAAHARLSGTGQVLTAPVVVTRLAEHLRERMPQARLEPPLGQPIDGVERLHGLAAEHVLRASVFSASR
ncbi:BadF/BadG/BcrA/BcrD ATPase family protein [Agromyces subbeticus]|uniref:BadF/BadG/BcrA/BcrD ATPase family protein n=1 Tax=Agromyces subbeticus TaxID=293890 RepID=UPI0003B6485C|nr:BadF/BadG/BcrA/BcrD ATPase family protein [Agromyces subbeticus]